VICGSSPQATLVRSPMMHSWAVATDPSCMQRTLPERVEQRRPAAFLFGFSSPGGITRQDTKSVVTLHNAPACKFEKHSNIRWDAVASGTYRTPIKRSLRYTDAPSVSRKELTARRRYRSLPIVTDRYRGA